MKLSLEQIKSVTQGAVRIEEEERGIRFYRFTKEQEELYKVRSDDFYKKTFATAGICLHFRTDSPWLSLKASVESGSSRSYFAFDVVKDGVYLDCLRNYDPKIKDSLYATLSHDLGTFEKRFDLGEGEKTICLVMPWSMAVVLKELSLEDGAFIDPVEWEKKMLVFGDSITQGYDALHPMNRYAHQMTSAFGAEEYNKAIGGEVFFPELAKTKDDFVPDMITVAYGSNDWRRKDRATFEENSLAFFRNLRENSPGVPIFVFTPIWRKDCNEIVKFGAFDAVEESLIAIGKKIENLTVISARQFVPEDIALFADGRLHPNDRGFVYQAENVIRAMKTLR